MKVREWGGILRRPRHILAQLMCLLAAVVIWLYVMYAEPPTYDETYRGVRVSVLDSENMEYTGTVDQTLNLRIYGTKAAIAECNTGDIVAYVRIADLADRSDIGPLTAGKTYEMLVYFDLPEGIEVREEYRVDMLLEALT